MTAEARGTFDPAALRRWIPAAVAVAVLVGAIAMVTARELVSPDSPDPPPRAERADDGFVRFRDAAGGISIAYPAGWRRVSSPDPEVRLLVEGDGSSMQVRMADLGIEVGPESLGSARKLTDNLVRVAGQVTLVRPPTRETLGGLPGYLYVYTFPDRATGEEGAHAHYFLFRGRTLITVVFEAVPSDRLAGLAPLFDRIGDTLQVAPG